MKFHIKPFGICAGSEKQGGQHEGRDKPVQAAASYFTTLTVDGQNRDLVNIWRNNEIEGGDQLIMHLAPVRRSSTVLYTLNHYNHGTVSKYMNFKNLNGAVIQKIPTFLKARELPESYRNEQDSIMKYFMEFLKNISDEQRKHTIEMWKLVLDHRASGYWHCAQTYTKSARYGHVLAPFSDHEYVTGALMQVNWAPVWKEGPKLEWFTDNKIDQFKKIPNEYVNLHEDHKDAEGKVHDLTLNDFENTYQFIKNDKLLLINVEGKVKVLRVYTCRVEAFDDQPSRTCAKPSHLHISAHAIHDISPEVSLVSSDKVTRLQISGVRHFVVSHIAGGCSEIRLHIVHSLCWRSTHTGSIRT